MNPWSVGGSLGILRIIEEASKETLSTQAWSPLSRRNHHSSLSSELTAVRSRGLACGSPR